jgi:4-amino-4-deoxy-L-arabinose transferase-like glycosyltransferase
MIQLDKHSKHFIWFVLLYGLFMTGWNLSSSSVSSTEALNIFTGRQVLTGNFDPESMLHIGSPYIYPPLAAIGDIAGGLPGARAVGIPFGLALTWIMYRTGCLLFTQKQGLLSAILFLATGTAVFFSGSASGDIVVAMFLGLSFYLVLLSEQKRSRIFLTAGASALFLASATKYLVILYALPFVIFVFWRIPFVRTVLFFLLPFSGLLSFYMFLLPHSSLDVIAGSYLMTYQQLPLSVSTFANWKFQWVEMPYLLAIFGMFHKEKGREAIMLTLFSSPIFFLYFLNNTEHSIEKNMIFGLVFLTHAAALGVDHMGRLFSSNITASWVRPFFTTAVLLVIWVFGIKQIVWFNEQYADIRPAVAFLKQQGHDGMTIAVDSADRYQEHLYRYSLEQTFPKATFIGISYEDTQKREAVTKLFKPDIVVCNEYYIGTYFRKVPAYYYEQGFSLANEYRMPFWTGIQNTTILLKEAANES